MLAFEMAREKSDMAENREQTKKKVYVETTVISDVTALPTNDLALMGRQITTRKWWEVAVDRFELYSSAVVKREAMRGDPDAARRRLEALAALPELPMSTDVARLAGKLILGKAVPKEYLDDALHFAMAAIYRMDYLVSWNFRHITNAQTIPIIKRVCADNGLVCSEICTPYQLQEIGDEEP